MADATKYIEILIVEDLAGERHYAVCRAYKAEIGDLVNTPVGLLTVKEKFLDLCGDMYRLLAGLNTILVVSTVWNLGWSAEDGKNDVS